MRDAWQRERRFDHGQNQYGTGSEEPAPSLEVAVQRHLEEIRRLRPACP
ncbi:MAG TPA: hypothetical protein VGL20_01705 [Candidatus Dormibacteraeota bacterium]